MQWNIDPDHSSPEFSVRHLGIATVRGRFKEVSGSVELDDDGTLKGIEATIDASSIDTGTAQRDEHLRSADFFDVEHHPTIAFRSTRVEPSGEDTYRVTGELTMHGQTHPVTLNVEVGSPVTDPWGHSRRAGTASGKLNRKDWGLTWNQVVEAGALLVGEEVKIMLDVQAVAPADVGAAAN